MVEIQSGNLNEVSLVEGKGNRLFILRRPKSGPDVTRVMKQVAYEHSVEGFFSNPSSRISLRSYKDQVGFSQRLLQNDIPTPSATLLPTNEQLIDFVPNSEKLFDLWLNQDPRAPYATPIILQAVMDAHEANLVLGDSTGKNELVTPEARIMLIDFDIKLSGAEAREFEFANLIYRLSRAAHRGNPKQLSNLGEIIKDELTGHKARSLYDLHTLLRYMQRFFALSSKEGETELNGMTPIIRPEHSAELFSFLIDVLNFSIHRTE